MKPQFSDMRRMLLRTASVLCMLAAVCTEPPACSGSNDNKTKTSISQVEENDRVSVVVARDRAKTMHSIYSATLDMLHHRYFRSDKAVLPARAMEDVFAEIKLHSKVEAQWISVNMKAMSVDHEPKTDFEKRAVAVCPESPSLDFTGYRSVPALDQCQNGLAIDTHK